VLVAGWLLAKWLFGRPLAKPTERPVAEFSADAEEMYEPISKEEVETFKSGQLVGGEIVPSTYGGLPLAGARYQVTPHLQTPSWCLEMNGNFVPAGKRLPAFPHDKKEDPNNAYGYWQEQIDYGRIGKGITPPAEGEIWTQTAMVKKDGPQHKQILAFLRGFRKIVESTDGVMEAMDQLQAFSTSSPEIEQVWSYYTEDDPDFPISYFATALRFKIGGTKKHTKALIDAGFTDVEKIRTATDAELTAVKGIGAKTVERIRERLSDPENRFEMD
jgi:hypothetical protein